MERLFGTVATGHLVESGMRTLAVQYTADFAQTVGLQGNDVRAVAGLLSAIVASFRNPVSLEGGQDRVVLSFPRYVPFEHVEAEAVRDGIFAFFAMATRILNGRISIRRERHAGGGERWTLVDEKRWLW